MKATGAEADRLITKGRDLSGVFPVELTEEANTEKNRIPSLFLVVSYYLKPNFCMLKHLNKISTFVVVEVLGRASGE